MRSFSFILSLLFLTSVSAQEIQMSETASLEQIYGEVQEAEELLPMNELGIEFGYALYEATITAEEENPVLMVENVRDYAAVYVDGKLQGWMTEEKKAIPYGCLQASTPCNYMRKISAVSPMGRRYWIIPKGFLAVSPCRIRK